MVSVPVLRGFEFFQGLDDSELSEIAKLCEQRPMTEGERIFTEGTQATHLHFCNRGKVNIQIWVRDPWRQNFTVREVQPGEVFAWSAIVPPYIYTASAECAETGEEIRIEGPALAKLFEQNTRIAFIIFRNLSSEISRRLIQVSARLAIEWLTTGTSISSGSTTWGEPKRR